MKENRGVTGKLSNIELAQLVQMVCLGGTDLCVIALSDDREGRIYIEAGNIVHAETASNQGEDALFEIAGWDHIHFELKSSLSVDRRTINKPWEFLMLEATRLRDEVKKRQKISVLIVDDSVFFAKRLRELIEEDKNFRVVGIASNGSEALSFLESEHVDVIIMDILMPVMSGDTAVKHVMLKYGIPVMVISAFTGNAPSRMFEFLRLGAVDIYPKQSGEALGTSYGQELRNKIKKLLGARVDRFRILRKTGWKPVSDTVSRHRIVVIAGSEGSYSEWFRLPVDVFASSFVFGFSSLHPQLLPDFSRLVSEYTGKEVVCIKDEYEGNIKEGIVYIFSDKYIWRFTLERFFLEASSVQYNSFADRIFMSVESLIEGSNLPVDVLFLSSPEHASSKWKRILLNPRVTIWIPNPDLLVCSQLVESVIAMNKELSDSRVVYCSSWRQIGQT